MSTGLRILSLDGGGTRGMSTLYILREIMNHIVPGNGGNIRPSEYFDIIGASGANALLALLFVRFAFTINEALEYFHGFACRMDKVEDIFEAKEGEDLDENDWKEISLESPEPEVQLETGRRQIVSNTWSELITRQITDWLERSKYKENGEFNFKAPCADIGVGRCRAAVMGSESTGYGPKGGVDKGRLYHAPIWHRSYEGRHIGRTYTLYAIALGTLASPGICSNGLIFPDFSAPGTHSVHNPVQLLVEECRKIWPGLKPGLILSIGAGKVGIPDEWDFGLHPYALTAAKACAKIYENNERIAADLKRYVLPHDEAFRSAYYRFDVPTTLPFFEFDARDFILAQTLQYLNEPGTAKNMTQAASVLKDEGFPNTWEDQIALSSLAFLLVAFTITGHNKEAELISDSISNFILYETTEKDVRSHRKLLMTAMANRMAYNVRRRKPWTPRTADDEPDLPSYDLALQSLAAHGQVQGVLDGNGWNRAVDEISSVAEVAMRSYFVLTVTSRRDIQEAQSNLYISALRQISKHVFMRAEVTPALLFQIENLLKLSALGALCEAAYTETLSAEPRILLSGPFIRHLIKTILESDLQNVDVQILEPIANAVSAIVRLGKWSAFQDPVITKLLSCGSTANVDIWGLINLAVEREHLRLVQEQPNYSSKESECARLCKKLMTDHDETFRSRTQEVAFLSVDRGYLGLLRKLLEDDDLHSPPKTYTPEPCLSAGSLVASISDKNEGNLLHRSAKRGFIPVHKLLVECLGPVQSKPALSKLDIDGLSPLHIACKRLGHIDTVLLCIYAGAELDIVSSVGRTALHYCFPDKEEIQDYMPSLIGFAQEHRLLITIPIKPPQVWGIYGAGREVDYPTFALRNIIRQLCCRGANTNIQDQWGASPGHLAAVNGWGNNVDMLFIREGVEVEKMIQECLYLKDKENNSILAVMRICEDVQGEKVLSAEMRKRCICASAVDNPQTTPRYMHLHSAQHNRTAFPASLTAGRKPVATPGPSSPPLTPNSTTASPDRQYQNLQPPMIPEPRSSRNSGASVHQTRPANAGPLTKPASPPLTPSIPSPHPSKANAVQNLRQPNFIPQPTPRSFPPPSQPYQFQNPSVPVPASPRGYSAQHPPAAAGPQTHPRSPPQHHSSIPVRQNFVQPVHPYTNQQGQYSPLTYPPHPQPYSHHPRQHPSNPPAAPLPSSQRQLPEQKKGKGLFKKLLKK